MKPVHISTQVDVDAAPGAVWEVVADFSRNPEWQQGMRSCTWLTGPPVEVGSRYQQVAVFLGRRITTTFEVVELERHDDGGGRITIDSRKSTFPLTITRQVTGLPTGTRVTADVAGRPSGVMGLLGPLMARLVKRAVDGDYGRLKALVEQ